jgi:EAL domain-containing protein (putative c-di-GMP-specific phosphodiesterase class I)
LRAPAELFFTCVSRITQRSDLVWHFIEKGKYARFLHKLLEEAGYSVIEAKTGAPEQSQSARNLPVDVVKIDGAFLKNIEAATHSYRSKPLRLRIELSSSMLIISKEHGSYDD